MSRSERVAKYNRLMKIEDDLGLQAEFDGVRTFTNINVGSKIN